MKRSELLEYLKELEPEEITEEEITVMDYAELFGMNDESARKKLNRLVDNGELSKRYAMVSGKKALVYKKA